MSGPAIALSRASKRYTKYEDAPMLLTGRFRARTRRSVLEALQPLDLQVEQGETLGVLGRNGAGKSTLLQLLCGVTAPTSGTVSVSGRVAPLISVGVGFHPELTGRENVYVNGTVLGMSRAEIDRLFDEIVAFAEVEDFIDTPVKFYSSGMFVRLGFAVAVAADPDVLLVDEVLAVGDFAFQAKCFQRMQEIRERGTTIVVVSHNIAAVRGLCERGVVLRRGEAIFDGAVEDAVSAYYESVAGAEADEPGSSSSGSVVVESFELLDAEGRPTHAVDAGSEAVFRMRVRAQQPVARPVLGLSLASEKGPAVYSDTNLGQLMAPLAAGERATYQVAVRMSLAAGGFTVMASLNDETEPGRVTRVAQALPLSFYVAGRGWARGVADLQASFSRLT